MKWEALKLEVASQVYTHISQGCNPETLALMLRDLMLSNFEVQKRAKYSGAVWKEYADKAYDAVIAWDVRGAGRLRDLFPNYWPKRLKNGRLSAYMADNENSDWMIE